MFEIVPGKNVCPCRFRQIGFVFLNDKNLG